MQDARLYVVRFDDSSDPPYIGILEEDDVAEIHDKARDVGASVTIIATQCFGPNGVLGVGAFIDALEDMRT